MDIKHRSQHNKTISTWQIDCLRALNKYLDKYLQCVPYGWVQKFLKKMEEQPKTVLLIFVSEYKIYPYNTQWNHKSGITIFQL